MIRDNPQTMTLKLLRENYRRGTFKFVKVNGEYRFSDAQWKGFQHSDMVKHPERAQAAGFIRLERDCWRMGSRWSESCQVGCGQPEIDELTKLLAPLPFGTEPGLDSLQSGYEWKWK